MRTRNSNGAIKARTWVLITATLAFGVLVAACGGPEATAVQQDVSTPGDLPAGVAGGTGPTNESDSSSPTPSATLDADAVVAAQEEVLARIHETVLPSVVQIRISQRVAQGPDFPSLPDIPGLPSPDDFFQQGEGSGFVWDDRGHIVTNNHVIQGADRVKVVFADRTEVEARVLGTDPDSDLAVLELDEPKEGAHPVALGDSDTLKVGQMAVAFGSPFGQAFTMTTGIVSALERTIRSGTSPFSTPEVIQTDAPINPGNSGGPLLDRRGRVIGVNTQIISRSGASAGVGLAVPINTAKQVIPVLIEDGRYEYSWLGITGVTLPPEAAEQMDLPRATGGALVLEVAADSPAERASLRGSDTTVDIEGVQYPVGGDVIMTIDGAPIEEMDDLIAFLTGNTRPGDKVTLEVIRDRGQHQQVEVTLGKRPNAGP